MRILLSNDDGYHAPGLGHLATALREVADVDVVAPDRDRSGASNSLTVDSPIRATRMEAGGIRVEGTPTDCVHLAVHTLLERRPDLVVSGPNAGANLGDDVLYSGTVAAAMEGCLMGLPAVAFSVAGSPPAHYETAARVAVRMIRHLMEHPLPADILLNVNVPDAPWEDLEGFETTRLGWRHRAEQTIRQTDPRGRPIYWIGPPGPEQDAGPGTDFHAVRARRVSVTPIQVDLTRYQAMDRVASWVDGMGRP